MRSECLTLRSAPDHGRGALGDLWRPNYPRKGVSSACGRAEKPGWLVRTAKLLPRGWGLVFGDRIGVNGVKANIGSLR